MQPTFKLPSIGIAAATPPPGNRGLDHPPLEIAAAIPSSESQERTPGPRPPWNLGRDSIFIQGMELEYLPRRTRWTARRTASTLGEVDEDEDDEADKDGEKEIWLGQNYSVDARWIVEEYYDMFLSSW
ncbi:hypothetical protein NL676_007823 [Syzygium grande]|nr:hypothetical protein NL676_007823 [Syzygium grande]